MICSYIPYDESDINGNGVWNKLSEKIENKSDHPELFNHLITRMNDTIEDKSSPYVYHEVFGKVG